MNYHLSIIALQEEQKRKKKEDGDEKGAKFVGRVKGKNAKEDKKFNKKARMVDLPEDFVE